MAFSCAISTDTINSQLGSLALQKTLSKPVTLSGKGLFTGEEATITLQPADVDTGIVFRRIDLPGRPSFQAHLRYLVGTPRCTILGNGKTTVQTVEHLLAALTALQVDNVLIELRGPEVPIFDGSSLPFVNAIQSVGYALQDQVKELLSIKEPVFWSKDEVHLVALPSHTFQISYTLHFPQSKFLGTQYYSAEITPEIFAEEIAPSRTFCLYEEITPFIEKGLIKGGGPNNAVIIKQEKVINPDGVRFPDEMARHKVLDLIGDLTLLGRPLCAHVIAIRSGHASNIAFVEELCRHFNRENQ